MNADVVSSSPNLIVPSEREFKTRDSGNYRLKRRNSGTPTWQENEQCQHIIISRGLWYLSTWDRQAESVFLMRAYEGGQLADMSNLLWYQARLCLYVDS